MEVAEGSCIEADQQDQEDQGADHGHHTALEAVHHSWRIGHSRQVGLDQRWELARWDHTQPKQGRTQPEMRRDGTDTAG